MIGYRDHQHPASRQAARSRQGRQVLAYPGTTLYSLEKALKPLDANRTQ